MAGVARGWNDIGFGRWLRSTMDHQLFVTSTVGGKHVAEVFKKNQPVPLDVKMFDDLKEARSWAEKTAQVPPMERVAWWRHHKGA